MGPTMDQSARLALLGFLLICVTSAPTKKDRDVDIYSFHINSTVISRYATTVITSRVANRLTESKEINFEVKIPKNAFISKFRMTIEGQTYDGIVKQKEEAKQQYSQAVSRGESAGLVSSVGRTLEDFKTSVTVAASSKVTFELIYEELLKRRLGKYELLIHAQPMQTVADFKVDVNIVENPGISFLEVKGSLKTNELASAITTNVADTKAWVNFYPTREQQSKCDGCGENGMNGDLIITYDVDRTQQYGEVQTSNGYFFHSFAPSDIQRIPKNVVFIIDRSGSMNGRKIEQTRLAMLRILGDLNAEDNFGLITFDSRIEVWKHEILHATPQNLEAAKAFVRTIQDRGATDINSAVLKGVEMINNHPRKHSASILILLTDGDPTSGETNLERIQSNVKKAIGGRFPLYCLGFGFDVNFNFLEKMALENNGVARRIYEDSDADLQLQGFYEEVATPLLTDVQMKYNGASNLTQTSFSQYYNGSEIIVVGQITDNNLENFQTEVIAISKNDRVTYSHSVPVKDRADVLPQNDVIQRMWAYLTVKQLLEKELTLKGQEKDAAKKEALDLSLKYSFVTPLTSMVVTKPQEETQVAHKPTEGPQRQFDHSPLLPGGSGGAGVSARYFHHSHTQPRYSYRLHSSPRVAAGLMPGLHGQAGDIGLPSPHVYDSMPSSGESMYDWGSFIVPPQRHLPVMPTMVSVTQMLSKSAPQASVKFLVYVPGDPKPYCYEIPGAKKLRLLMDPSSEFFMNGELLLRGGFREIVLHYKTVHLLTLSTTEINYTDGQNPVKLVWDQEPSTYNTANMSLIRRENELDITMGNIRISVFLHKNGGRKFLWPTVRQKPNHANIQGILGLANKIAHQPIKASSALTLDFRFPVPIAVECWSVVLQDGLEGKLSDYTVPQL